MATVAVLIPTYEREDLLQVAIASALAQTYDDLVVLVGDNSRTDTTEKVVRTIDDPRIHYHRNLDGVGPQQNWLDLIARADTPLVATLHDDDEWLPGYLEAVVPPMLEDPSIAMTFTDFWMIDGDGNVLAEYTEEESARTHRSSMPGGTIDYDLAEGLRLVAVWNAPQPAYAAVLRRDAVRAVDFPTEISPLYDIWLSYQLVKQGAGLRYEPQRLTRYRIHSSAITSSGFARPEDEVFHRIIAENADVGPVIDEIAAYWSSLRWARATRLLGAGAGHRATSQDEFLASAAGLEGPKRLVATAAGKSKVAWQALAVGRGAANRLRDRRDNGRYVTPETADPDSH